MNLNPDEVEKLNEKSQIDDDGRCKQNVTDGCKWAYRDFLNAQTDLIDNGDLKYCYDQTIEKRRLSRIHQDQGDYFLGLIQSQDSRFPNFIRTIHTHWFDRANKSCKF